MSLFTQYMMPRQLLTNSTVAISLKLAIPFQSRSL
nr:MAG TPA_asm: hypothetical protein [Caudoviricetes sp.]